MWEKYSDLPYLSETDPNGRGSCTVSVLSPFAMLLKGRISPEPNDRAD